MIRRFFKHFIESLKSLKRNGWMTVAAISSVTVTLTLVGIFGSVIVNTTKLASDLEKNVRIVAYMKLSVHDQEQQIQDDKGNMVNNDQYQAVYRQLMSMDQVKSATFSSRQEQLDELTERMGDTWSMFRNDSNPLYDAYIIDAKTPSAVKDLTNAIKGLDSIEKVQDGEDATARVFAFANMIRVWGLAGTGLLLLMAVFLISNTIRITIISRSREIQIMRLVGAKNSYIRGPFLLEGAWVGFLGALIPAGIVYFLYVVAYRNFNPALAQQSLSLIPVRWFVTVMGGGILILGILIGALGASLSMRRYLKV
ncbi:permease-like cell division protein FtsX [Streptococcus sp. DD13]|uniref:permease-like cell division protein FtsX n=1 Tax=Streptococcus sp. DD13 TaxID=1777881 RepID=UPI00079AEB37|nr:permease-like cell division protein FtsX [Streptococcus sp. DD13]KXT78562.1 Cell division protein FtsX [Streptococcus sp. DD13]